MEKKRLQFLNGQKSQCNCLFSSAVLLVSLSNFCDDTFDSLVTD